MTPGPANYSQDQFSIEKIGKEKRAKKQIALPLRKFRHMLTLSSASHKQIIQGKLRPSGTELIIKKKHTILENSTRILFGNRPGLKGKRRRFKQDLSIWRSPKQTPKN